MKAYKILISYIVMVLGFSLICHSQELRWYDPVHAISIQPEGQGWPMDSSHFYSRLPEGAGASVRKDVYDLAQNNAGLIINFTTNAPDIKIIYGVKDAVQFPHMPATGVSGIDLYVIGEKGNWMRATGRYSYGDTIQYSFTRLIPGNRQSFKLYLPLYNTVSWLRIGIDTAFNYRALPPPQGKPIVVYGTSIAQGACASRPGMAWTAILGRTLKLPVINLGFSGNGRLEPAVIQYINEIDARLYILDCLPNIADQSYDRLKQLITASVEQIRKAHPNTPILLTEHLGFGDEHTNAGHAETVVKANKALQDAFSQLLKNGTVKLTILHKQDIGLTEDSFVDNIHPNDAGMLQYAEAYRKSIEKIRP